MTNFHEEFLRPKETAFFLKVSLSTLARWRHNGLGPQYVKIETGRILYKKTRLLEFIEQNEVCEPEFPDIDYDEDEFSPENLYAKRCHLYEN